ncbi:hypothetical protein QCE63_20740 [Caballeronia sp. LZ065]|uniref:hypothetical protein n=1 Tax=Caballeronia sp. LZ065 TaxID=3038571 RepID=UPI0028606773|nr:hypothetical protein [Caballeronia sp. LZ065]MDR5781831.1 hypothetical protein [Caballeronia sp. LZ065]
MHELDLIHHEVRNFPALIGTHESGIASRSKNYYRMANGRDLLEDILVLSAINEDLECDSGMCSRPARYILADHLLNKLLRMLDACLASKTSNDAIIPLIDAIKVYAGQLVALLLGSSHVPHAARFFRDAMPREALDSVPRVFLEGDNHALSISAGMFSRETAWDCCIGILLGGGAPAALLSAIHDAQLNFLKLSAYDDSANDSDMIWGSSMAHCGRIRLIDDNCGTGHTLNRGEQILNAAHRAVVGPWAAELHWEKMLRVTGYQHDEAIFDARRLDTLSPWSFRHHRLLKKFPVDQDSNLYHTTLDQWADFSTSLLSLVEDIGAMPVSIQQSRRDMAMLKNRPRAPAGLFALVKSCSCTHSTMQ